MEMIRIGIEIGKIDCIRAGGTRRGRRQGRCGHFSSGRKSERAKFLLGSGRRGGKGIRVGLVDSCRCSGHRAPSGAGRWFLERVA